MATAQERDREHIEQLPPRETAIVLAAARTGGAVRVLLPMVATLSARRRRSARARR
ncbi:MAG TPA: hypothetical protein VKC57_17450 [Ktedonobacterales bacterium]|nr:hypothetical protein [Ktedonobacterales bacterium]